MTPGFTGSPLVRDEAARHDPALAEAAARDPAARLLVLDGYMPTIDGERLRWAPLPDLPVNERVLLGRIDGVPRFARADPAAAGARRSFELMEAVGALAAPEAATYAVARSLLDWHARHRFCAQCGTPSLLHRAGWARHCPACDTEHFPRTDPVVIMLAEHDGQVLVGRQPQFPPHRYSALAGFVEVGEGLEEAVRRELFEEAGVTAGTVRFVASQPWPFPSQLMLACIAEVAGDALTIDRTELEDAMWVSREDVRAALAGADGARFLPPPPYAIAHTLFEAWLASDEG